METRCVVRGVRLSVDKGRLVADLIRGKKVDQALNILTFTQKNGSQLTWNSLIVNVSSSSDLRLKISTVCIDVHISS